MGATLLGGLTALQLDLVLAAGERLMNPVGLEALIRTTATAGLTGLLCWVICALVARAISRHALRPYDALADHFERLADGDVATPIDLRGPVAGVRRLARAAAFFHQGAAASRRAEADLQIRYDRLYQEQADERRLLMGMLMRRRLDPDDGAPGLRALEGPAPSEFDIPERPSAVAVAARAPAPRSGQIVDLAGRLRAPARSVQDRPAGPSPVHDLMPLDFVFVGR